MDSKQLLLVNYLISSPDTYAICSSILDASYFNPGISKAVAFLQTYYQQYSKLPSLEQIHAETGTQLQYYNISPEQIEYCITEVEQFCKSKALEQAIMKCAELYRKNEDADYSKIVTSAQKLSIHRDLGLDYFNDPLGRLTRIREHDPMVSTGWQSNDEHLNGGVKRGQLMLFGAPPGGGKSMVLANYGVNFVERKFNVLYISLELDTDLISLRLDSMITSIGQGEIRSRYKEAASRLESEIGKGKFGKFKLIQMNSGTRAIDIRSYIDELYLKEGWKPDLLLVDYLDLMTSNEKVDANNTFLKDKYVSEEIRNILVTYNMFGASATQLNRSAIEATDLNQSHTAGGISKVNTTDNYIAVIMNDVMKASGQMLFHFLKTRSSDGVGKKVIMSWDSKSLRIRDNFNKNTISHPANPGSPNSTPPATQKPNMSLDDLLDFGNDDS